MFDHLIRMLVNLKIGYSVSKPMASIPSACKENITILLTNCLRLGIKALSSPALDGFLKACRSEAGGSRAYIRFSSNAVLLPAALEPITCKCP